MTWYRKKPVVVEAFQWTGGPDQIEDQEWICDAIRVGRVRFENEGTPDVSLMIDTPEGTHRVNQGDWIIRGVKGELYPCKSDIFAANYELPLIAPDDLFAGVKDWQGLEVGEVEPLEKVILVWEITPHPSDASLDSCVEREYARAVEMAQESLATWVDEADEDSLKQNGFTVTMKLISMTLGEYKDILAATYEAVDNAPSPRAEADEWRLLAPDGRQFTGKTALQAVRAEIDSRIPPSVQLARVLAAASEPDFAERHVSLGKFYGAANTDELIDRMEAHVLRLQEKVAMMRLPQPSARPKHVREG